MGARGGATIAVTDRENKELRELCEYCIFVPTTHEYLMPLVSVIPLQLIACMMGILRGNEIDNPRNLKRSVMDLPSSPAQRSSPAPCVPGSFDPPASMITKVDWQPPRHCSS